MSTVHGTSPVFLGSFVLRNEQHWEHAAPFFCKACQRCSLMDRNSPLWEVVTLPEMGENREGSVAVDLCSVGQMQERSSHRAQPAQHPWAYWISGRHKKDVSSREAEALSPIPTVPRQASCSGKSDPAHDPSISKDEGVEESEKTRALLRSITLLQQLLRPFSPAMRVAEPRSYQPPQPDLCGAWASGDAWN